IRAVGLDRTRSAPGGNRSPANPCPRTYSRMDGRHDLLLRLVLLANLLHDPLRRIALSCRLSSAHSRSSGGWILPWALRACARSGDKKVGTNSAVIFTNYLGGIRICSTRNNRPTLECNRILAGLSPFPDPDRTNRRSLCRQFHDPDGECCAGIHGCATNRQGRHYWHHHSAADNRCGFLSSSVSGSYSGSHREQGYL